MLVIEYNNWCTETTTNKGFEIKTAPGGLPCDNSFHYAKHSHGVMWILCNEEELWILNGAETPEETVRRETSQKAKVKET